MKIDGCYMSCFITFSCFHTNIKIGIGQKKKKKNSISHLETIFVDVSCIGEVPLLSLYHFAENDNLFKQEYPPLLELLLSTRRGLRHK